MRGPWLRLTDKGVEYRKDGETDWFLMETNHSWFILTALRGPDNGDEASKEEYTGRIRGLFCAWGEDSDEEYARKTLPFWMQHGSIISVPKEPANMDQWVNNIHDLPSHYVFHVSVALNAIKETSDWPTWE